MPQLASLSSFLPLLFLGCLTSLSATPVEREVVLKSKLEFTNLKDELFMERVIQNCYKYCWELFLPSYEECVQDNDCYECYGYCPFSPYRNTPPVIAPSTTTTTTTPAPTTTAAPTTTKINKSIQETWSLHTVSMLQQDSLVLVDIAWDALNTPNQCLISWEVSGGGLMGNLLTESSNVQLSLWPDTKYRVKVTCKNKFTGFMSRSLPLSIDTSEAVNAHDHLGQHKTQSPNTALPYDERDDEQGQSVETVNKHTNFIFNWHSKNSDISAIEPVQKPDINMLTIAALSDIQKPLLFGLTAGIVLLTLVLVLYICLVKRQKLLHDKKALLNDTKMHTIVTTLSPAILATARANKKAAIRKGKNAGVQRDVGVGGVLLDGATPLAYHRGSDDEEEGVVEKEQGFERAADEVCSNPTICSRNALKV